MFEATVHFNSKKAKLRSDCPGGLSFSTGAARPEKKGYHRSKVEKSGKASWKGWHFYLFLERGVVDPYSVKFGHLSLSLKAPSVPYTLSKIKTKTKNYNDFSCHGPQCLEVARLLRASR